MTTDRELLELAAKAAQLELTWVNARDSEGYPICGETKDWCFIPSAKAPHNRRKGDEMQGEIWNPLDDDGDAMRLAVKLHMRFDVFVESACVTIHCARPDNEIMWLHLHESLYAVDEYVATRRAIVRAAAEIGSKT